MKEGDKVIIDGSSEDIVLKHRLCWTSELMANLLRPVAIAAGGLGIFQGTAWGILSLLGILMYKGVIHPPVAPAPSEEFQINLIRMYFDGTLQMNADVMTPSTVAIWSSLYLATSLILAVSSGYLLQESLVNKFSTKVHMIWLAAIGFTSLIDFMATVCFGLDIGALAKALDGGKAGVYPLQMVAAGMMMTLAARGFLLWFINLATMTYIAYAAVSNLEKEENDTDPNMSSVATVDTTDGGHLPNQRRISPIYYQPEPLSAWNPQSPIIGNTRRSPWIGPESVNRVPVLSRSVRPPKAPPLPTPQPDYSPPLGRPVKHEPNLKDVPARSVLKKPYSPQGRTIL